MFLCVVFNLWLNYIWIGFCISELSVESNLIRICGQMCVAQYLWSNRGCYYTRQIDSCKSVAVIRAVLAAYCINVFLEVTIRILNTKHCIIMITKLHISCATKPQKVTEKLCKCRWHDVIDDYDCSLPHIIHHINFVFIAVDFEFIVCVLNSSLAL